MININPRNGSLLTILCILHLVNTTAASLSNVRTSHWRVPSSQKSGSLEYLKTLNGKYAHNVKLLGSNPLTKRVKALLKTRYSFLKKRWVVETPIEVEDFTFKAYSYQQHNCDNVNFIIVVDLRKDVVYVGVKENDSVKVYSEDGSDNSTVREWGDAQTKS